MRTQRAQLRRPESASPDQPRANITRSRGNAFIQTTPSQVRIDSFESRASMGHKSAARLIRDFADNGRESGRQAVRNYAEQGNFLLDSRNSSNPISDLVQSRTLRTAETILAFIPSVPPEITVEEGAISFDFTMDQLNFDWSNIRIRPEMEFVPGEIEFTILEYPKVIIEFIGGPVYVPPSSAPDYVPSA